MKKIIISALICIIAATSFGMDKEKISIKKIAKDNSGEPFFFKAYHLGSKAFDLYRFHLSINDNTQMEENADTIAAALVACEKEMPGEEASTCELVRLEVIDKKQRKKGYGSIFLQQILNYMTEFAKAQELGLLSEPSADISYESKDESERMQDLKRLDSFYLKNGFKEVEGISGAFVFNLRDNKI